jgi:tRNA(Ile)-lysidine synthase TilS/MesJ
MNIEDIDRALTKRYRAKLFSPFIKAIQEYKLLSDGDIIGVCLSGGKDSFVLAKLFQELLKHGKMNLTVKFLVMDPGFHKENLDKLKENAEKLGIPIIIKESDILRITEKHGGDQPCYLCARMRRGFLYKFAQSEGCNKIALGHHFNDVIETTMLNILYAGNYKTMVPKIKSKNYQGMELIRPMVFVQEKDIINYMKYCGIEAMNCGCKVASGQTSSKRKEIKQLIANLKKNFKDVDKSIYRSAENVNLNCLLGWQFNDKKSSFLDFYDENEYDGE